MRNKRTREKKSLRPIDFFSSQDENVTARYSLALLIRAHKVPRVMSYEKMLSSKVPWLEVSVCLCLQRHLRKEQLEAEKTRNKPILEIRTVWCNLFMFTFVW